MSQAYRNVHWAPTFWTNDLVFYFIYSLLSHYFSTRSGRRLGARPLVCLVFLAGASSPAKQLSPDFLDKGRRVASFIDSATSINVTSALYCTNIGPCKINSPRTRKKQSRSLDRENREDREVLKERTIFCRFRTRDRGDSYLRLINYCLYSILVSLCHLPSIEKGFSLSLSRPEYGSQISRSAPEEVHP